MLDTGINVPESFETLLIQQRQLVCGRRPAQMFPIGTPELDLPMRMKKLETKRGVFHFNPLVVSEEEVLRRTSLGEENVLLNLGPFSKGEIFTRVQNGERLHTIGEFTLNGTEVRLAIGSTNTLLEQQDYFEATKERENEILLDTLPPRISAVYPQGVYDGR